MNNIPREIIIDIRERINIVEVVSKYVELKRAGRNFVGFCPFHSEKTPSFIVNEEKQVYRCFGACADGGDVIKFLMKINKQDFYEVIMELSQSLGINLSKYNNFIKKEDLKEELFKLNKIANSFFRANLKDEVIGKEAREYLKKREISEDIISKFEIGFSPDNWDSFYNYLLKAKLSIKDAEKIGLIIKNKKGNTYYDRFRGRITFPIYDLYKRIVGFGGRILTDKKEGGVKYLNSPESIIYKKGHILYGLDRAKEEAIKEGYIIVVEGYLDLITMQANNITNSVAVLGTSLTPYHINILKRLGVELYLMFDSDKAGKNAIKRSIVLGIEHSLPTKVIELPEGEDPDSFLKEKKNEGFKEILKNVKDGIDWFIEETIRNTQDTIRDRTEVIKNILIPLVNKIKNPIQRELTLKKLSNHLAIKEPLIKHGLNYKNNKMIFTRLQETNLEKKYPKEEKWIIQIMLNQPSLAYLVKDSLIIDYFKDERLKLIGKFLIEKFESNINLTLYELADSINSQELKDLLIELSLQEIEGAKNEEMQENMFNGCIISKLIEILKSQRLDIIKKIGEAEKKGENITELQKQYIQLEQKIESLNQQRI